MTGRGEVMLYDTKSCDPCGKTVAVLHSFDGTAAYPEGAACCECSGCDEPCEPEECERHDLDKHGICLACGHDSRAR